MRIKTKKCLQVMVLAAVGFIGLFGLSTIASAETNQPIDLSSLPELGTRTLNSGGTALIVNAGTEKKTAYFRFGINPTKSNRFKWDVAIETPYDEDKVSDPAVLADFDGLANSTTIQGNLSRIWIIEPKITKEFIIEMNKLCGKYLGQDNYTGGCGTGDLKRKNYCKVNHVDDCSKLTVTNEALEQWKNKFLAERKQLRTSLKQKNVIKRVKAIIGGVKAKVGKESFKYNDAATFESVGSTETPWSIAAYGNYMHGRWVFGGGAEYQESYKEKSKSNVCIPLTMPADALTCTTVRLGAPVTVRRKLIFADLHWASLTMSIGIAPRVTYDFEEDEVGILLPIYLLGDEKRNLTGGVSLGWQSETEDFTASIFVGKAFSFW